MRFNNSVTYSIHRCGYDGRPGGRDGLMEWEYEYEYEYEYEREQECGYVIVFMKRTT